LDGNCELEKVTRHPTRQSGRVREIDRNMVVHHRATNKMKLARFGGLQ